MKGWLRIIIRAKVSISTHQVWITTHVRVRIAMWVLVLITTHMLDTIWLAFISITTCIWITVCISTFVGVVMGIRKRSLPTSVSV
jgi:hypothetical protein